MTETLIHHRSVITTNKIIDFRREPFSASLFDELLPMLKKHYDEIALYKDIALSPDLMVYENSERMDMLRIFTARYEGRLVGYQCFFVFNHSHYSVKSAQLDAVFIEPEIRQGMTGYIFLKWCDSHLEDDGIKLIYQSISKDKNFGPLLERMGYQFQDVMYSRRIA
jgi:hypothetical protein